MLCPGLAARFVFNHTASPSIYTLSLHDALPILFAVRSIVTTNRPQTDAEQAPAASAGPTSPTAPAPLRRRAPVDRKSTRLNSSHLGSSYAVFCLKKKKKSSTYV